ncbi:MAG: hypothetical protein FWC00_06555 [Firmicutes bacterium]|nr:hypothetical protein [Bacillota bacterium]
MTKIELPQINENEKFSCHVLASYFIVKDKDAKHEHMVGTAKHIIGSRRLALFSPERDSAIIFKEKNKTMIANIEWENHSYHKIIDPASELMQKLAHFKTKDFGLKKCANIITWGGILDLSEQIIELEKKLIAKREMEKILKSAMKESHKKLFQGISF